MNWGLLGNDEIGDLSMRASHSSHLPYCYLDHHQERIVECAIRNLDGVPGERGLSGGAGTQGQVNLWALIVQLFSLTPN
jgi:hypothetical protein